MRVIPLALAATFAVATGAFADDASRPRGVIELFTSQGCSSCPPADRLASELARDPSNLVLTLPVDYWDYLGWKDTLASPANSARQRAYAMARGDRKVFTPQIVVNGRETAIGGDGAAVAGAVTRAEAVENPFALPVRLKVEEGRVAVAVEAARRPIPERHGEVWAFAIERTRTVQIGRGENAGRTVTYANVVRKMVRLGAWDGAPAKFEVPIEEVARPETDGVAVLVQAGSGGQPGAILGATQADSPTPPPSAPAQISRLPRDPL
ncbi:DUF1223 domain-containing protein [Methylopila turkensis]|uniref:DUF1223 domain-containing protein n=1 Tax=Methylopila turkensis TaxID=1437816 RepID=A0A9W6JTM5_9HYPH|nr:DUF1223 domain-containing protein [Methylopila turkensis]GLK81860.1 hypothetical protein GCM10008174_36010 [Methylopila turkensis]